MDPTSTVPPPGATVAPVSTGSTSGSAPVGYKIVKVRKADGTLATVKRKLSPGEESTATVTTQVTIADTATSSTPNATPDFKIVTVRKADGTLVKVRRPVTQPSGGTKNEKATLKRPDASIVDPSPATTDPEPARDKPATAATPAVAASIPGEAKPATADAASTAPSDKKDSQAVVPITASSDRSVANNAAITPETKADERELVDALAEQAVNHRERRTHRFKSTLLRGFGMAVGSAIPSLEISNDFEDGDEIMSDDDDWSVDDGDDDDKSHNGDDDEISDELHASNTADHGTAREVDNSASGGPQVTFDAGAALGGLAATAAASAAAQPPPPPPPPPQAATRAAQNGANTASDAEKEKHTYKISVKELADLENATTEKVNEKKLSRHWANVTFYIMASLSIVLPCLFLLLACFIYGMRDKLVTSKWSKMEDAIKVAISAWPIVFAAVVAQCFKAWATFKVERGIKLMELEQLVGSSSFASAMKQPILLRRMDLLTIALFGVWCLSPIGSQALVRVYDIQRELKNGNATVRMVPSFGPNKLFTPDADYVKFADLPEAAEVVQLMTSYYISALSPDGFKSTYYADQYMHPFLPTDKGPPDAAYGALMTFPDSQLENDVIYETRKQSNKGNPDPKYETLTFNTTYSYFNFTCDDWHNITRETLNQTQYDYTSVRYHWSDSETMGVAFTPNDLNFTLTEDPSANLDEVMVVTGVRLASANGVGRKLINVTDEDGGEDWQTDPKTEFSHIQCSFQQIFMEATVSCFTEETPSSSSTGYLPDCYPLWQQPLAPERVTKNMTTRLLDFSDILVAGNPGGDNTLLNSPVTLNEIYLKTGSKMLGDTNNTYGDMNLVTPDMFAERFGFLFNTIVRMGYCPECVNKFWTKYTDNTTDWSNQYKDLVTRLEYARDLKYVINIGWLVGFTMCSAFLLIAGTAGVIVESMTIAPDVLGYVSTVARNSRYLQLPKVSSAMSGGERAKTVGGVKVMMQDVKGNANVGKIALGLKHEKAKRLVPGRLYR